MIHYRTHVEAAVDALANATGTYKPRGGGSSEITGLFTDEAEVAGLGLAGMTGRRPRFTVKTSTLPAGHVRGDFVVLDSVTYVVEDVRTSGQSGRTDLILKVKH
jgi:hypothetical protein